MILRSAIDLSIFTRIHGRKASLISFSFWDSISQTQVQAFFNFKTEPNNFFNTNMFMLKQHEYVLELVTKWTFGEPIPTCRTVSHSGEHLSNRFLVIKKSFLILNEISFFINITIYSQINGFSVPRSKMKIIWSTIVT